MRQSWLCIGLWMGVGLPLIAAGSVRAEDEKSEPASGEHGHTTHGFEKYKATGLDHKEMKFDLAKTADRETLVNLVKNGEIAELEGITPIRPMEIFYELGIWTILIFVLLLIILRKTAWTPMLQGLHKREETIKNAVEEAKRARADTERITVEFQAKMDQAYAEIPKIMEKARREAEAFKEEMRAQTAKDVQLERQRLRREIETARDQALQELWNQAAQLATLISAKAIGRSLTEEDHRRLLDEAIVELGQSASRG